MNSIKALHHDQGRFLVSRDTTPLERPRRVNCCVRRFEGMVMRLRKKPLLLGLILLTAVVALPCCSFFVFPSADFTAVDFDNEYKDWKAADERYHGKSLSIRGKVLSVHHGGGMMVPHGWTSVVIGEGPSGVLCHFPPEAVYQTEYLVQGQTVVIRGVCKGSIGCPILSDCRVVGTDLPQTIANLLTGSK